jgi:hypothetical protein
LYFFVNLQKTKNTADADGPNPFAERSGWLAHHPLFLSPSWVRLPVLGQYGRHSINDQRNITGAIIVPKQSLFLIHSE